MERCREYKERMGRALCGKEVMKEAARKKTC